MNPVGVKPELHLKANCMISPALVKPRHFSADNPVATANSDITNLGVSIEEMSQEQLGVLVVEGTPTLILIDNTGTASDIWIGKLKRDKEAEVLSRF